jgi:O-antigen/teichoic acid export membrane protein
VTDAVVAAAVVTEGPQAPSVSRLRFASAVNSFSGLGVYALARSLGPAARGDYAAVVAPTELMGWFFAFGMPMAALYYARDHDDRSLIMGSWALVLSAGSIITAAVWVLVPSYLHGHSSATVPWFRVFLLMAIPFGPLATAQALLMARGKVVPFNVLRQLSLVLNTAFVVAFALGGHLTLTTALGAALVGDVVWCIATTWYVRAWPGRGFRRQVAQRELRYAARVAPGSLSSIAINRLDQLILVGVVASSQLALYAVAATAAAVSTAVSVGVSQALVPHLRGIDTTADRTAHAARAAKWTFAASATIAATIGVTAPVLIPLLFGRAFAGAVPLLWILLPGQVAADLAAVLGSRLLAEGRPGITSQGLIVGMVVTVVGLAIAVKPFGTRGAAVVTVLSQFAFLAWVVVRGRRRGRHAIGAPRTNSFAAGLTAPRTTYI